MEREPHCRFCKKSLMPGKRINTVPVRLLPHAKMLLVPMSFFLSWVDYAWKVLHFHCANVILAACFTLKGHGTHQFTVVFASGRQDLPSDARAFSLTSFEA